MKNRFFQISLKYFESAADGQLFGNIWNWFSGTAGTKMLCQQEFLNRVGGRWDYRNLFQMTYWVEVVKRINFLPELWNWNSAILPCQTEYRHGINDLKSNFKKKNGYQGQLKRCSDVLQNWLWWCTQVWEEEFRVRLKDGIKSGRFSARQRPIQQNTTVSPAKHNGPALVPMLFWDVAKTLLCIWV